VLVVDDAEWPAVTLEVALVSLPGAKVVRAANGEEAWRLIQTQAVTAIVTDLHMPGMDGFALIERVRASRQWATLPIIVVSGDDARETRERTHRLGANDQFAKPYSPAAVRHRLEELLHLASFS